jgi:hypothetical protein
VFLKLKDEIVDFDLDLLEEVLSLIDAQLVKMFSEASKSADPDQSGLLDRLENLTGLGFAACQTYLVATFGFLGVERGRALQAGPLHPNGEPIARLVSEAANYWKHHEEWGPTLNERQAKTLARLRTLPIDPDSTHLCSTILPHLVPCGPPAFGSLVPALVQWRDSVAGL